MLKALRNFFGKRNNAAELAARVDTLYAQGVAAWNRNDYAEAAAIATNAIALDASLPVLHFMRASALLEANDFGACVAAGEAGLALNPPYPLRNDLALRVALAQARADATTGRPAPAAVDFDTANPFVSVIVCSITPARFDKVRMNYQRLLTGVNHEIIGIHDARSLCEGYNRGARQARGNVLVFSHDDVEIISEDFAAQLLAALDEHDLVGVIGSTRAHGAAWIFGDWPALHGQVGMPAGDGAFTVTAYRLDGALTEGIQAVDGLFMAARRQVVEAVPFDEATFDGWHLYDMDFSFRAHLAGFRCATLNTLLIAHESLGNPGADWRKYATRFLDKHRGAVGGDIDLAPPAITSVSIRSADEWRCLTAYMTAQRVARDGTPVAAAALPPPSHHGDDDPRVSVVICSIDAAKFARATASYRSAFAGIASEIIGIHDARSICEGYRRGLAMSRGEVVIFSHDDVEIAGADFAQRLLAHLRTHDLIGVAGTTQLAGPGWADAGEDFCHGMMAAPAGSGYRLSIYGSPRTFVDGVVEDAQAMDGVFLAARRPVAMKLGFDAETFNGWHLYDMDFSWRAFQAGYRTAIAGDLLLIHAGGGNRTDWEAQARRFIARHGLPEASLARRPFTKQVIEAANVDQLRQAAAAAMRN